MKRANHNTAEDARRELISNGFVDLHAPPGAARQWARPKDKRRFAIGREDRARCSKWHIVEVSAR